MIYVTKYDTGADESFDLKLTLLNKSELEQIRTILKRTHGTAQINFIYSEK